MGMESIISAFSKKRMLVVGDYFLDLYLLIDPDRTEPSLETGLPAYQVTARRFSPGAAGTVAKNLSHLGVQVYAAGFTGDDGNGYDLRSAMAELNINTDALLKTKLRVTPTYTKPMHGESEMSRLDIKNFTATPLDIEEAIIESVKSLAPKMDAAVILDQVTETNCGVITERVRGALNEMGGRDVCPIFYADSRVNIHKFKNVTVKCNDHEAVRALGGELEICARAMSENTGRPVFITRGKDGMLVCSSEGVSEVAGFPVEGEVDICGAGDAATAGITAALASGGTLVEAAVIGNASASVAIRQLGTTGHATAGDLRDVLQKHKLI